jgi:hypothetical protein
MHYQKSHFSRAMEVPLCFLVVHWENSATVPCAPSSTRENMLVRGEYEICPVSWGNVTGTPEPPPNLVQPAVGTYFFFLKICSGGFFTSMDDIRRAFSPPINSPPVALSKLLLVSHSRPTTPSWACVKWILHAATWCMGYHLSICIYIWSYSIPYNYIISTH